ncbi:SDR family NAD(P)-dependent oxidoreductase [Pectobacterium zantedeschiae]|uniref:SDR family NAD(P)-dependent oxidoreductase n=1 Tax=Pectobacterium zantedeschiae TaxID=2034769 RepID=UPI00101DD2C5|nr:SDR family oxidoreductase [Pectobacterium zantedeschiae]RYC41007.1 SDR family oxidoreductase [Pectobacterium zantedeschiae]
MTEITPSVLVTGASTGLGAVYADRFARRGHNLVLVARDVTRMEALATGLRAQYSIEVDVLPADLTQETELDAVAKRLETDTSITILVNNAGMSLPGTFTTQTPADIDRLIAVNLTAVVRLARAVAPRLAKAGTGSIINISSVVGLAPEFGMTIYGATKAFVLFLSQGLSLELGPQGVYVQAVVPAVTRTEIWERAGTDINTLSGVMEAGELVDAALTGFDRRESVTIPPLYEESLWTHHEQSRQAMLTEFGQEHAAPRYLSEAK